MKNLSPLVKTRILFLIALIAAGFGSLSSNQAATITITNINDSGPGSLRQALVDANDGDTIQFVDSRPLRIDLTSGELLVNKSVTITATSAKLVVSRAGSAPPFRIFHIAPGKNVSISRLNILNGATQTSGGGIYNDHAALTLNSCLISGNSASAGGGGGGVYNNDASLTINYCLISNNSAEGAGGGIYNYADYRANVTMTINNSTISSNSARGDGGGISSRLDSRDAQGNTTIEIDSCTVSGNSTSNGGGGGISHVNNWGDSTELEILNSTLSGNSAVFGGGIYNTSNLWSGSQQLVIYYSTLSGNVASVAGGGIYNGAFAEVRHTFIGNNILKTGASGENISSSIGLVSYGYNLSNDNGSGFLTGPGDQINTDPMIGPLQHNGGPPTLLTHAPLTGSPAIDTGFPGFHPPPGYDERGPGYPRVVNGRIDIGAIEVQAPPPRPTPTPRPTPPPRP